MNVLNQARLSTLARNLAAESIADADLDPRLDRSVLLGIETPEGREPWYPRWQFRGDGTPHPLLARLLASAAQARMSPWQLHLFLTNPRAGVNGRALVLFLDSDPALVLDAVSRGSDIGS